MVAGRYSRVNLQSKITPEPGDGIEDLSPFLSILDSAYVEFDDSIVTIGTHVVTLEEARNLPLISYRWYKNINLWWIIGMYNGIADIWLEVEPGTRLRIPSLTSVEEYFERIKRNNSATTDVVRLR